MSLRAAHGGEGLHEFGVIRPGWDVERGENAFNVDGHYGHCFYSAASGESGERYPGPHDWEGRQRTTEQGDRVGMLLDLDRGSMTVWKNDVKLGVMQAEGLSGPLCWSRCTCTASAAARASSPPRRRRHRRRRSCRRRKRGR